MFDKILIGVSILISSILLVENLVTSTTQVYILIWYTSPFVLVFFSIIIGMALGYGIRGFLNGPKNDDYEGDF